VVASQSSILAGGSRAELPTAGAAADHRRADLQGLRAVAVLAVIAYHFELIVAPGGFVGVDVFFVLSGFFITRLLLRDLDVHGRIRFGEFWARRIKRLLPNGLLAIFAVLVAGLVLLPSYRLLGLGDDAFWSAVFLANFHFAEQSVDYFRLDDPPSPLLHYWSLAVEEQFYVLLPLTLAFLALVRRDWRPKAALAALAAVAVASFVASLDAIGRSQPEAFFLLQNRAWQLAVGGIAGLVYERRQSVSTMLRSVLAVLGALAIAASIILLDDLTPYPGYWALAPTLGTAFLILGLDAGGVSRGLGYLLSRRPMVRIGDMSYSLYLWHWPVMTIQLAVWPVWDWTALMVALLVTALLSWAAFRFVERPVHLHPLPTLGVLRTLATGVLGVAMAGATAVGAGLLPGRTDPVVAALLQEVRADLGPNYANGCHLAFDEIEQPECRFGQIGGPRAVLFGDSHAAQWFTAVVAAGEQTGWEVQSWTKTSCPSFKVTIWFLPRRATYDSCETWRSERIQALLEDPPAVVLLANATNYFNYVYDPQRGREADDASTVTIWQKGLDDLVDVLTEAGIGVVKIRDTPRMYSSYRDCLSSGEGANCARPRNEALSGVGGILPVSAGHEMLDLSDDLCTPYVCPAMLDGAIVYRDSHHLTATHAASLAPRFVSLLERLDAPRD
jgi:peptidoglycan/LPS O-acetylase OafA/YrhL